MSLLIPLLIPTDFLNPAMNLKPAYVARVQRAICVQENCPHLNQLDYSDDCAFCPAGHWSAYDCKEPVNLGAKSSGLGDLVEKIAKPIAIFLNLPCLDEKKQLRPESPCGLRKAALNKIRLP